MTNLVVWKAVYNDEFDAASRTIIVDYEVFTGVDVFVVMEPADFRCRRAGHDARQCHLTSVGCHNVLQVLGESRRLQLLLRN